jgi:alkanesulfonate monooxygenase SsuD/methylene tetrahydromethanopterin reductase-like flavin-dependent oxidoreductase (luciferase family)
VTKLGFFTYLGGERDANDVLHETVELFRAAEDLGYDSVWVAQHHFGPTVGSLPSPLPFLANVAARTTRVRLGTAVVILPAENPVRLAEDAAVVDLLSGGRLELGLGSGTDPEVFTALGFDPGQRRELMSEHLETLLTLLAGRPISTGHTLHPSAPGLSRRVWQGVFTPERAVQAARAGTNLLLPKASTNHPDLTADRQAEATAAFHREWPTGRVALSRPVYVSSSHASALRELDRELVFQTKLTNDRAGVSGSITVEDYIASGDFHLGSPDEVEASLRADPAVALADELIVQVGHFGPGLDNTLKSLAMFREVFDSLTAE